MAAFSLTISALRLSLFCHLARATLSNLSMLEYREQQVARLSLNSNSNDRGFINTSTVKWPTCPPWKYHKYHNSSCECGSGMQNVVHCKDNQSTISLVPCYCMSYNKNGDGAVIGACPFLCGNYFYMDIDADTNLTTLCDRYSSE